MRGRVVRSLAFPIDVPPAAHTTTLFHFRRTGPK